MKKLLVIVVLGLLWSNISFSEIIKFHCKPLLSVGGKITYVIDTSNNVLTQTFVKGSRTQAVNPRVLKVSGKTITYNYVNKPDYVYEFNYAKNNFITYQIKPTRKASISCGTKDPTNEIVEINTLKLKSLNDCVSCNLAGADLSGANLAKSNLDEADLSGADLSGANLYRADLYSADLSGADLSGANLTDASLYRANLTDANLSGADLRGADLDRSTLCNTIMPWGTDDSGC